MSPEHVSALKYMETRQDELEKRLRVQRKGDRKQLYSILKHKAKALELQALDYKEHFERLNGEAGRILKAIEVTVSRDTWDGFQKEFQAFQRQVDIDLAKIAATAAAKVRLWATISTLSLVIGVVVAIMTYVK